MLRTAGRRLDQRELAAIVALVVGLAAIVAASPALVDAGEWLGKAWTDAWADYRNRASLYARFWRIGGAVGVASAIWVLARRDALSRITLLGLGVVVLSFLYFGKVQHRLILMPVQAAFAVSPLEIFQPPLRLPLALMLAPLAGVLWTVAWRGDWRAMGDAVTLLSCVAQTIGRFGCFFAGCCTGTPSALPWSVVYPDYSDAHVLHTAMGWIAQDAGETLSVHPLPLYFSLYSAATGGVFLWMLLRRWRSGALFFAALLVNPIARLTLEQFRGGLPWRDWAPQLIVIEAWIALDIALIVGLAALSVGRRYGTQATA